MDLHQKAATHRCTRATVLSRDCATEQRLLKAVSHMAHLLNDLASTTNRSRCDRARHSLQSRAKNCHHPVKKVYGHLRKDVNKGLPETTVRRHGEMYRARKRHGRTAAQSSLLRRHVPHQQVC
uniref:Uncharacterized protein n=1 Tax=Rhipicephalus appendiculatus TaxID=34631 RepID=A0A131YE61_RHIAP